jgi:hypothetical protein
MTATTAAARYYVHDRAEGQATALNRFSAVNNRYWIMDASTGKVVDEFSSANAARGTARDMNRDAASSAPGASRHISALIQLREERARLARQLAALDTARDDLISSAFAQGEVGATTIARASGLTTAGVYKIRNRRSGGTVTAS